MRKIAALLILFTASFATELQEMGWQKIDALDFIIEGDFLYWQAAQSGVDYAVTSQSPSTTLPPQIDGKVNELHFDFAPGYRLKIGHLFSGTLWDLLLNWTHLENHAKAHRQSPAGLFNQLPTNGLLLPTRSNFQDGVNLIPPVLVSEASAQWDITLNVVSLELGRAFLPIKHIGLRPFAGLIAAWIDQDANFDYRIAGPFFRLPSGNVLRVGDDNDFEGYGLRSGLDLKSPFGKGWSLYGRIAGSLLSGRFDLKQHEKLFNTVTGSDVNQFRINEDERDLVGMMELAAGISWDCYFVKDRIHLGLRIGYEFQEWLRQNRLVSSLQNLSFGPIARDGGDLGYQGLAVGARLDF